MRACSERGSRDRSFMPSGGESVADAPYRLYPARLLRIIFDRAAQAQDGDVYGPVIALAFVIVARQGQQAVPGQGFAGVADQRLQQIDFASGELDGFAVLAELAGGRVKDKRTKGDRLVFVERGCPLLAAQDGLDARQQLARVKGLAQVVVRAGLQADDPVDGFVAGGQ
jgi:hypothetical protein